MNNAKLTLIKDPTYFDDSDVSSRSSWYFSSIDGKGWNQVLVWVFFRHRCVKSLSTRGTHINAVVINDHRERLQQIYDDQVDRLLRVDCPIVNPCLCAFIISLTCSTDYGKRKNRSYRDFHRKSIVFYALWRTTYMVRNNGQVDKSHPFWRYTFYVTP